MLWTRYSQCFLRVIYWLLSIVLIARYIRCTRVKSFGLIWLRSQPSGALRWLALVQPRPPAEASALRPSTFAWNGLGSREQFPLHRSQAPWRPAWRPAPLLSPGLRQDGGRLVLDMCWSTGLAPGKGLAPWLPRSSTWQRAVLGFVFERDKGDINQPSWWQLPAGVGKVGMPA